MAISIGDRIPDVEVMTMGARGPEKVSTASVLGSGKVVLFAVPGAFTPTCSDLHLPSFIHRADELKEKGVDVIACIAVNDVFVMDAWSKAYGVSDNLAMLADGNGEFAKAMGLEMDGSGFGMGMRSQRYAAVVEDGILGALFVEQGPGVKVSSADSVLEHL
ncbi:MAG: redoxin family protein [Acidimicrobiales bacterium]